MPENLRVALAALGLVTLLMGGEAALSGRNARRLRARGAVEPPGDVYPWLAVSYPAAFLAMAAEGAWAGVAGPEGRTLGALVFVAAKLLKYWAVAALGDRWSFRVLVLPGAALVTSGPYRWLRHPNYLAVGGEILGMAVAMRARIVGPLAFVGFALLLRRRIAIEERALGLRP